MAHALALGARGLGQVWPWPSVGCVLVRDGHVVGRGTSDAETLRHAERVALDQAGDAARGATAYVTLEPCAHQGRTLPCTEALIAAGIARVVVASDDPNPLVAGQGLQKLRAAGIPVETGLLKDRADQQHKGFFSVTTRGRPMLTLKLATTLDGRIATATGESRWITGPEARRVVHAMRMSHDAVLVGGGTARADDPTLTVRDMGAKRQPVRIVAARRLGLPWPNRLAATIGEGPVWLIHGAGDAAAEDIAKWENAGATLLESQIADGQIDPRAMLETLAAQGLTRVFCEGGGMLAASLLSAGLVDELVVMTAGLALGAEGQPGLGPLGVSALAEAERFDLMETRAVGGDVLHHWVRKD
jgi:diaminohydroxyphosphoribosylaminopyrimidine deaminase/5-amino-6-(5-phosphoribosylamino)uracil reductase